MRSWDVVSADGLRIGEGRLTRLRIRRGWQVSNCTVLVGFGLVVAYWFRSELSQLLGSRGGCGTCQVEGAVFGVSRGAESGSAGRRSSREVDSNALELVE
jgi:hypothetical protein